MRLPGRVLPYRIGLYSAGRVFRRGHRIAVQVQSSWLPLIDRNPHTFMPNIFHAKPADFKAQNHAVHHTARCPSAISLQVAAPSIGKPTA